jgi:LmbE family N-acetylglucosaminyl deacetylase
MVKQAQVIVITPHPDDAEFGVAGTVARWVTEGKIVIYVVCTSGDKGTSDPKPEFRKDLVRLIRLYRPETVVTADPYRRYIWHRDHRITGQVTLDAVFPYARDRLTYPDLIKDGLEPHKVREVLLWGTEDPNYYSDITDTFDKKVAALRCHRSQIKDNLSSVMEDMMRQRAKEIAQEEDFELAESFHRAEVWW